MSAPEATARTAPPRTVTVQIINADTNVRTGVSTRGPNIIQTIQKGKVEALCQCTGQDVSQNNNKVFNYWWVCIVLPNGRTGWVSATNVKGGVNNGPIPEVPQHPTVNVCS